MENPALVLTSSNTMKLRQNNGTVPLVQVYDTDDLIERCYVVNLRSYISIIKSKK